MVLFVAKEADGGRKLRVCTVDESLKPRPGDTLVSLIPETSSPESEAGQLTAG